MTIRAAAKTDYAQLIPLLNDFVGEDRYSNHENDSIKQVLASDTSYCYVLEDLEKLIGIVTFSIRRVIRYPKPIAELDELYVDPQYRSQGLGKMLVQHCLEQAKELGCYRMYIESHYDRQNAHKLYESIGFTNYGYLFMINL